MQRYAAVDAGSTGALTDDATCIYTLFTTTVIANRGRKFKKHVRPVGTNSTYNISSGQQW